MKMSQATAHRLQLALSLMGCSLGSAALAATPAEQRIAQAPMPHALLGAAGEKVSVHFARLQGYLDGAPDNQARLARMKSVAEQCASAYRAAGRPARPPVVWPDFVTGQRSDTYVAANRTITYTKASSYAISPLDCSLQETETSQAMLSSSSGVCQIDLIRKRAHGACGPAAHAKAALRKPGVRGASLPPGSMASTRTGVRKTVLGLECEEWKVPALGEQTVCLSLGGTFPGAQAAHWFAHSGLALEVNAEAGMKMQAVEARIDTQVDGRVFAPYLASGFNVIDKGERK